METEIGFLLFQRQAANKIHRQAKVPSLM